MGRESDGRNLTAHVYTVRDASSRQCQRGSGSPSHQTGPYRERNSRSRCDVTGDRPIRDGAERSL
ncbi:Hypothetical predicted protein [Xyrichtys novacula]|uniref:Uncharacterized protein n=1 Tax=Xyrichtys novacula TaxID=13765 RepID=A0AAV1FDD3_XYRNO|nr:Hypothetical predicted protein [Xyrichtys novacula]